MGSGPRELTVRAEPPSHPGPLSQNPTVTRPPGMCLHAESREALIGTKRPHLSSRPVTETGLGACPEGQTCPVTLPSLPPSPLPCSHPVLLPNFSASSPVRNLTVEAQTNSSITLRWEAPGNSDPQVYWIWWTGGHNATGSQNTTNTSVTVEGLEAGTLYKFCVCAVQDGLNCSWVPLNASTGERQPPFTPVCVF